MLGDVHVGTLHGVADILLPYTATVFASLNFDGVL
jgi:hypothetical protein